MLYLDWKTLMNFNPIEGDRHLIAQQVADGGMAKEITEHNGFKQEEAFQTDRRMPSEN